MSRNNLKTKFKLKNVVKFSVSTYVLKNICNQTFACLWIFINFMVMIKTHLKFLLNQIFEIHKHTINILWKMRNNSFTNLMTLRWRLLFWREFLARKLREIFFTNFQSSQQILKAQLKQASVWLPKQPFLPKPKATQGRSAARSAWHRLG